MTPLNALEKPRRRYSRHGFHRLKAAVKELGGRVIDRRTSLGKALARWRAELIEDLGGRAAVSAQEEAVVDLAVKTKLILDSVDAWLLTQPSLVNARKRALLPVVLQRQQVADALARYMTQLGLKRRARPVPSLEEYLAQRYSRAEEVTDQECGDTGARCSSPKGEHPNGDQNEIGGFLPYTVSKLSKVSSGGPLRGARHF